MINFDKVWAESFAGVSFEVREGASCKIIAASEHEKDLLLDLMLSFRKPEGGRVFIFGADTAAMTEKEAMSALRDAGVVWGSGGLVSNLKIWENITLPAWYHGVAGPGQAETKAMEFYGRMGRDDADRLSALMGRLPGELPAYERRVAGLARAVLMEPRLMIYDSLLDGVSPRLAEALVGFTREFHTERPGRASVYLTSLGQSLVGVRADVTLMQEGGSFVS